MLIRINTASRSAFEDDLIQIKFATIWTLTGGGMSVAISDEGIVRTPLLTGGNDIFQRGEYLGVEAFLKIRVGLTMQGGVDFLRVG